MNDFYKFLLDVLSIFLGVIAAELFLHYRGLTNA